MKHLARLDHLERIFLSENRITDEGLQSLANKPELIDVRLDGTGIKGPGLSHLRASSKIRHLGLGRTPTGDDLGRYVAALTNLGSISVGINVTSALFEDLPLFPKLHNLNLTGSRAGDRALEWAARVPTIESIWANGTEVTDDGLAHLRALPRLEFLGLGATRISDQGLRHIAELKSLKRNLILSGTQVTDAGLAGLSKFA